MNESYNKEKVTQLKKDLIKVLLGYKIITKESEFNININIAGGGVRYIRLEKTIK